MGEETIPGSVLVPDEKKLIPVPEEKGETIMASVDGEIFAKEDSKIPKLFSGGIVSKETAEKFGAIGDHNIPNINPNLKGIVSSDEMKEMFKSVEIERKKGYSVGFKGIVEKDISNATGETIGTIRSIPPLSEVDKDIKAIVNKTEEIISSNPFEKLMEKLKKVLDFNKDNKIDFQDLKEFLKLFAGVLIVVYFVIFTLERDEILAMWISGIWDLGFLYDNIIFVGISAIGAFFFNMFKKRWLETDTLMTDYKSQSEDANKIIAEIKFQHDLAIEKINHKHALEIIGKEIEIKSKEEITRIEIVKADIIEEIKKLLPGPVTN